MPLPAKRKSYYVPTGRPRGRPRKLVKILKHVTWPCSYSKENYLDLATLADEGIRPDHHVGRKRNRSYVVRKALDIGFRKWKPEPLPYRAEMPNTFRMASTNLLPEHLARIREIAKMGYTQNLAFNIALGIGIEEMKDMRRKFNERRRIVKHPA